MKAVVDTNIFIGACLGSGAASKVIAACLRHQFTPLMGTALLCEHEDVLERGELFKRSKLTKDERSELLDIFFSCCEWTRVYYLWRPNVPDEADNHLVELAIAGGVDFLITRNLRDLGRMELRFPQLRVVSPEEFLKEL